MKDTVFESIYQNFIDTAKDKGIFNIKDISKLILMLREYESDCHVVIAGQNGVGKTYLMLMVMKEMLKDEWMHNLMLAKNTTSDIVMFILQNESTIVGLDEMNQYLDYKKHASGEQEHLISMIELARSKRIGVLGCVRDPRKLSYNYRTGKMSVVIWILDRYTKGGSYAAVFVASPMIESEDRFGFDHLYSEIVSFDEMRTLVENIPTFIGYMKIPHVKEYLSKLELDKYRKEKKLAIAYAHLNHLVKRFKKKQMDETEFNVQLDELRKILPEDDIDAVMPKKASSLKDFMG